MVLIAHAGHWLTSVAYFVPVVGFLVWLGVDADQGAPRRAVVDGAMLVPPQRA